MSKVGYPSRRVMSVSGINYFGIIVVYVEMYICFKKNVEMYILTFNKKKCIS